MWRPSVLKIVGGRGVPSERSENWQQWVGAGAFIGAICGGLALSGFPSFAANSLYAYVVPVAGAINGAILAYLTTLDIDPDLKLNAAGVLLGLNCVAFAVWEFLPTLYGSLGGLGVIALAIL